MRKVGSCDIYRGCLEYRTYGQQIVKLIRWRTHVDRYCVTNSPCRALCLLLLILDSLDISPFLALQPQIDQTSKQSQIRFPLPSF